MMTLFSEKMLMSTKCVHRFMPNLIKKYVTVSRQKIIIVFFSRPSVFYYAFSSFHESVNIDLDSLIIVPIFFQCQF